MTESLSSSSQNIAYSQAASTLADSNQAASTDLATKYDSAARDWRRKIERLGYPAAYRALVAAAMEDMPEDKGVLRVMDMGTGTGALAQALMAQLAPQVGQLDLFDLSPEMLTLAKECVAPFNRPMTTAVHGIGAPEIPTGRYDVILCAHVLEHLDDPEAALAWLKQRMKPGGVMLLAISKPHWCTSLIRLIWGSKAYAPDRVAAMMGNAGISNWRRVAFRNGPPSRTSAGYIARRDGLVQDAQ